MQFKKTGNKPCISTTTYFFWLPVLPTFLPKHFWFPNQRSEWIPKFEKTGSTQLPQHHCISGIVPKNNQQILK